MSIPQSHQLTLQKINILREETKNDINVIFQYLEMLQNDHKRLESLLSLTLDQLDFPEDKEINYDKEEFNAKYAHIINQYFIELETKNFFKVEPILKDWQLKSSNENVWTFDHPTFGEKVIEAENDYDALNLLSEHVREISK